MLTIRNRGPVPSKKNDKQISKNQRTGKLFLRTDDEKRKWIEAAILDLLSQLNSAYRTAAVMQTTLSPRFWTCSSLPANDSTKHIRRLEVNVVDVPEGQEGAMITITNLDNETDATEAARVFAETLAAVNAEDRVK